MDGILVGDVVGLVCCVFHRVNNLIASEYMMEAIANELVLLYSLSPSFWLAIIIGYIDHIQSFFVILVVEFTHMRIALAAWYTPACPKVDDDHLTLQRRESERLAIDVFGCEIRCRLARIYFCQYFQIYILSIRIQKITIDGVLALGICAQG